MAKNLKLNIKNTQLAEALNIGKIKPKRLAPKAPKNEEAALPLVAALAPAEEEPKRVKARAKKTPKEPEIAQAPELPEVVMETREAEAIPEPELAVEAIEEPVVIEEILPVVEVALEKEPEIESPVVQPVEIPKPSIAPSSTPRPAPSARRPFTPLQPLRKTRPTTTPVLPPPSAGSSGPKLGPTGKHVKDLLKPKAPEPVRSTPGKGPTGPGFKRGPQAPVAPVPSSQKPQKQKKSDESDSSKKRVKEFQDVKPLKKQASRDFDGRARQGLISGDDEAWRKRRSSKHQAEIIESEIIRPTSLSLRLPISIKDFAAQMKLKASQLISKLFMQGLVLTLNDLLDDETIVKLIGHEFGCTISIDTAEEERIRVTNQTVQEEIASSDGANLTLRPPVVAFMGHVDHGKTSLIDAIRKSNRAAGEAGSITQHIGAFGCSTAAGQLTILDTPGHEAFSAMRERGAGVTDIVVLVIAGDEGIRQQTIEALEQAKKAGVTIVVAINKCDKPSFNAEQVYQQLATHNLLPEAWGGTTITVNCSALTGQGVPELLEMLALQSDVLELKANTLARARGSVLESAMHKGFGPSATVLVQNGSLKLGDAVVFSEHFGRIKTMHDENGLAVDVAGPSTAVLISGLSSLPDAGEEFVVVKNEKEARSIAEARLEGVKQHNLQQKKRLSIESFAEKTAASVKEARFIIKADVQGSLEALKTCLEAIRSTKITVNIVASSVGEISESDVQRASASSAIIIGFHTRIESHAEPLIKELGVKVYNFDIIYHAIEEVKKLLVDMLDKIPQEKELGAAEVRAIFKSSQLGLIAGCSVTEGSIFRNAKVRLVRGKEVIWKGGIASLKRVKEDVKEVKKGFECGIVLDGFKDLQENDIIQAYEIEYLTQEL